MSLLLSKPAQMSNFPLLPTHTPTNNNTEETTSGVPYERRKTGFHRTRSQAHAKNELQLAKQFLVEKRLIKEVDLEPRAQNIMAIADFEQTFNLEELAQRTRAIYETEQSPGATLRL